MSNTAAAQTALTPVVVTASKQEKPVENVAASVTVISREQIESQNATTVPEVLRNVAGADLVSTGSPGDDVDVRLRGADRDEVLVMIDGVAINDVREHRAAFLGSIPLDNVERIEIVRGSQSILYGSDAVGGVINIITRKGSEKHRFGVGFEGGNLQTFRESAEASGSAGADRAFQYAATFSRTDQRGRFDRDRFGEDALSANFGYQFFPGLKLDTGVNYFRQDQDIFYEFQTSFDPATGSLLVQIDPDTNNHLHRDEVTSHVNLKSLPMPWWDLELHYGIFVDREHLLNPDAGDTAPPGFAPNNQDFHGHGLVNTVDLRNFFSLHESPKFSAQLTVGFEFQDERLSFTDPPSPPFPAPGQKGARQNYAPYFQQELRFFDESLILTGGARYDHNTTFGHEWSPAASLLYKLKKTHTTFRASYGEGFHAPTILEFFSEVLLRDTGDPSFQPVRLQSELSKSVDVGIDQSVGKWADVSATFFFIDYHRLFDQLQFVNNAYSTGIEVGASVRPLPWLTVGGNYTFLKAINQDTNQRLTDRPRHHGNAFVEARPIDRLTLRTDVNVVGSRLIPNIISTSSGDIPVTFIDPNGNTSASGVLPGYVKVDLAGSYDLMKNRRPLEDWKLYFKIENLLNRSYQEKFGFPAPGITFLAGTKAIF